MSDKWELYPAIEKPEVRQLTWDDMLRLAYVDPAARQAVVMAERGDWTREQALIVLAFASYDQRRTQHHETVDRLNRTIPDFVLIGDKRYDRKM